MGGNALKVYTRRYNKDEFFDLWDELKDKIGNLLNCEISLTKSYHTKESFGDMDILVRNDGNLPKNINDLLIGKLGASDVNHNSNCYSFDYKELQIDLIIVAERNWETSNNFFSYNDLGNFIGRIYRKLGLKFGHDGLCYRYLVEENRKLGEFVVTKDFKQILEFIGLSHDRYLKGFDTMKDVYDFIISSKYFSPQLFYYKNLNHKNRTRDRKRKNYNDFIKYIEMLYPDNTDNIEMFHWSKNKEEYFPIIASFFKDSNFYDKLNYLKEKEKERKIIASKFNGNLVLSMFSGIGGKLLGSFICEFKKYVSEDNDKFKEWVKNSDNETIKNKLKQFYDIWCESS